LSGFRIMEDYLKLEKIQEELQAEVPRLNIQLDKLR
jgi:hypothetical protein